MATDARRAASPVPWTRGRVAGWLVTTDHKRIGILYLITSLLFLAAGGVLALLIRTQLIHSGMGVVVREDYNAVITMHGTTMIFLGIVPVWAGFANYLVPLMIGARDMAFPRLNAFSYWMFAFGGLALSRAGSQTEGHRARAGRAIHPSRSSCPEADRISGSSRSTC